MERLINKLQEDCDRVFLSDEFNEEFYYEGNDLGFTYDEEKTEFRLWSPVAKSVALNLYETGDGDSLIRQIPMSKSEKGTWFVSVDGNLDGVYYTYVVTIEDVETMSRDNPDNATYAYKEGAGIVTNETADPYSRAVGVNGNRSMVVDFKRTSPKDWENDTKPEFYNMTDAVIYEMHVRDISSDESSGIENKCKFIGLVEQGRKNPNGSSTGIDHMKELGITHVHILPAFDYQTVDESKKENDEFNWGYDPKNYNVPEGSYSTNPFDGAVRIKEFKEMVKGFHDNGIRVVMDVVFNHTFTAYDSCFTKTVPNYYYRTYNNINTNGSGCGNETASEHKMFRKYMIDSVLFWAKEYHVDGFRFDLMAVHDIDTMNQLVKAVKEYDSSLIIYGEGWTGGPSKLEWSKAAFKENALQMSGLAMFSDDIRDAVKGSVMEAADRGFVNGGLIDKKGHKLDTMINSLKFGICGSTKHPQVKTRVETGVDKDPVFWANNPTQTITYVSVHDNWTLWDKLALTCAEDSIEDRIKMNKLSAGIIFMSQGIPLFQAGEEMLRSKPVDGGFEENSYKSPDSINSIKWCRKDEYKEVVDYYKGLIEFRKAHSCLRMTNAADVAQNIVFMDSDDVGVVIYEINATKFEDGCEKVYVVINGTRESKEITLPDGEWKVCINNDNAGNETLFEVSGKTNVDALSIMVMVK